jgi:hypothetical protein
MNASKVHFAKVIPLVERKQSRQEFLEACREFRHLWKGPPLKPGEIKEMIEEGRA